MTSLRIVVAVLLAAAHATAANIYFTSAGQNGAASSISTATCPVPGGTCTFAPIGAQLGDGTLTFNGGLVQAGPGGAFYAIANDALGSSSLYTNIGTVAALVGSAGGLGAGFTGGLAFDGTSYWALANDGTGNFNLFQIATNGTSVSTGSSPGTGFNGFAYDPINGLFYGIGANATGESFLYSWQISGNSIVDEMTVSDLGQGFGGLSWDPAAQLFWTIGNVDNAGSQFYSLTSEGALTAYGGSMDGMVELAVIIPPDDSAIPEPATGALAAVGVLAFALLLHRTVERTTKTE